MSKKMDRYHQYISDGASPHAAAIFVFADHMEERAEEILSHLNVGRRSQEWVDAEWPHMIHLLGVWLVMLFVAFIVMAAMSGPTAAHPQDPGVMEKFIDPQDLPEHLTVQNT